MSENTNIAYLESMKVPTDSFVQAGLFMSQHLPTNEADAKAIVKQLTGRDVSGRGKHPLFVPLVAAYAVQIVVRAHIEGVVIKAIEVLQEARERAESFTSPDGEFAWTLAGYSDTDAEIEDADPEAVRAGRAKKGAKKVLGLRVYRNEIAGPYADGEMTRKEAIAILVEQVGLSHAGASTYFANFTSGKWV
jgi:hypothetical protein